MNLLMDKSTFLIKSTENKSFGTAFCIKSYTNGSFFLTCQHVVASCGEEFLEIENKKAKIQKNIASNELIDLAVLYVKGLRAKALPLSSVSMNENDTFSIKGFKPHKSLEYKEEVLEGTVKKVSNIHTASEEIRTYELSIEQSDSIEKGYSGSAIVSKTLGQVMAVATDRTSTGKQAYAIPITYLCDIWEACDEKLFDTITPFVGLSAFSGKDSSYFFGRDKETEEILTLIKTNSILAVIGDSGSGKSSLIKAGVIPKLLSSYEVIETRPARNPFLELARCVTKVCENREYSESDIGYFAKEIESAKPKDIHRVLDRLFKDENKQLLLYIDQFEELFTMCNEELQKAFTDTLLFLLENQSSHLKVKIIFTMRRDYYNLLKDYPKFYACVEAQRYLVKRMKDENLREVIEKPLELLGVNKEEIAQLSKVVLWDMGDEAKEITLLQIALTETWTHKAKYEHNLMSSYVGIGRVTGALSSLANNAMESLDDKDKELFKYIFIRIVKFNDIGGITRHLADKDEFSDEAWELVQKLASVYSNEHNQYEKLGRLLKLRTSNEKSNSEEVVELIHEALTTQWSTYVEWIRTVNKENRKRIHNVLIEKSKLYKKERNKKFLLLGYALEESRKLLDEEYKPYLSKFEMEFIEKSQKSENRTVFWKRFGVFTLVILLGLSGYFGFRAEQAKNRAEVLTDGLVGVISKSLERGMNKVRKEEVNASEIFTYVIENFEHSDDVRMRNLVSSAYIFKGIMAYEGKSYDEVIKAYKKAIELNPKNEYVYNALGLVYDTQKEYKKSIKSYAKALEINTQDESAYNGLGMLYHNQKEYKKAIENYKKAIEINPKYADPYKGLGNVYYSEQEYEKAIENYKKVLAINPKNEFAYNSLGNIYDKQKEYKKAIENSTKAIEINPKFEFAYISLGNVYNKQKEYKKAIESYEKAREINPEYEFTYIKLGNVYENQKEYKKAIESYQKVIAINPKYESAYDSLGNVYTHQKKYKKAIENYEKAITIKPKYEYAYSGLGNVYDKLKEYEKAIESYKRAIEINPKNQFTYNSLGNIYDSQKKYEKAIENYEKAIELNPKNGNIYNSMGMMYYFLGKYDKAIEFYIKAVNINSEQSSSYANLFELQLMQSQVFNKELESKYIEKFSHKKETFIKYEMLEVLQTIVAGQENKLEDWKKKYKGIGLGGWRFDELHEWANTIKDARVKANLQKALKVFEGHDVE